MKKNLLLGITGGIAAYKVADLASNLSQKGMNIQTIMTESAQKFITPLTIKSVTHNHVYTDQFDYSCTDPLHIQLLVDTDIFVVAPATANIIAKMAHGLCDDLLSTSISAYNRKIVLIPAMNTNMWYHPITQNNLNILKNNYNIEIIEPAEGLLACQTIGKGKFPDVEYLSSQIIEILYQQHDLKGYKILVTAGGTKEPIDPVRFISNRSSGKMGITIADNAHKRGADVTLISTQSVDKDYPVHVAPTSLEMLNISQQLIEQTDILVMSAAVADYYIPNIPTHKIKKSADTLELQLTKTPDILADLGQNKRKNQIFIGFAAESENLLQNAHTKLKKKNLDMIIANDISQKDCGFDSDSNEVYFMTKDNYQHPHFINKTSKTTIAKNLWDFTINTWTL